MMISLDLAKSSEVRKAGDQSKYKITFQVLVKKAFRQSGCWIWLFLHVLQRNFEEKLCFSGFGYPICHYFEVFSYQDWRVYYYYKEKMIKK